MPGGTLTITAPSYDSLKQVAASITCWSGGVGAANTRLISTTSSAGPVPLAFVIPEALWSIGALTLKRAGANIVSGLAAGSHTTYFAGNGLVMDLNANTCPARTDQPTVTSFTTNVGGNPLATSLVYANVVAAGTVSIDFGDGTVLTAQAESGTVAHNYPHRGIFTITITDESVPANVGSMTVVV
jgi:hypothetical protein